DGIERQALDVGGVTLGVCERDLRPVRHAVERDAVDAEGPPDRFDVVRGVLRGVVVDAGLERLRTAAVERSLRRAREVAGPPGSALVEDDHVARLAARLE